MSVTPLELAKIAAVAADDKQAEGICLLDLTQCSDVADYFLIASADNPHKLKSIVDEVEDKVLVNTGEKPLSSEGAGNMEWVLLDYGCLVVHLFTNTARHYYRLEKLYGDAKRVQLDLEGEMDQDTFEAIEPMAEDVENLFHKE